MWVSCHRTPDSKAFYVPTSQEQNLPNSVFGQNEGSLSRSVSFDYFGRAVNATAANTSQTPQVTHQALYEYDGLGRPTETKVGVVEGSLTSISSNAYDATTGNLSSVTLIPGGTEADRVTRLWYDWRGRLVATKAGGDGTDDINRPLTVYELDNLGQAVAVSVYDADGLAPAIGGDGTLAGLQPGQLRARTEQAYDAQGRVYRSKVFNIDQTIGANGPSSGQYVQTDIWYDKSGRVIKQREPGGLVTKTAYNNAGRVIDTWITDGGGDSGWNDAGDVSNDIILEHVHLDLDANGNTLVSRLEQRKPDGTMRTSRTQNWYDAAGRLENSADLGTLGGTYASPVDALNDGALLSGYAYDPAGNLWLINDPAGVVTSMGYDAAGRMTSKAANTEASGQNERQYVDIVYDGLDRPVTTIVQNWLPDGTMTPRQYTHNRYGTSNGLASAVASNDLLGKIDYPDGTSEKFGYNALGQMIRKEDRNTVTHTYAHDVVGRTVSDLVTADPQVAVDMTVQKLSFQFDALGRLVRATSEGDTNPAAAGNQWGDINQVVREYNGFGQLAREFEEHNGTAVTSGANTSYHVQYVYDTSSGDSRLQRLAWQDGRQLWYGHDGFGRVSWIADGTPSAAGQHFEDYAYLGLSTIVGRDRPTGLPDQAVTLDAFGRVEQITWGGIDSYGYGYDANGNVLWRQNLINSSLSERYVRDSAGRQTGWQRGQLDANHTIPSPSDSASWTLDSQGNRYGGRYGTAYNLDIPAQTYTATLGGLATQIQLYDGGTTSLTASYDAWGRLVRLNAASSEGIPSSIQVHQRTYAYDALGRRIVSKEFSSPTDDPATATPVRTMHSYHDGGVVIEERDGAGTVHTQYVWSPDGQLVLRDRDADAFVVAGHDPATGQARVAVAGLDERLWVLHDGQGSTTALIKPDGTVAERYVYDQDGRVTALRSDWSEWPVYSAVPGLPNQVSTHYGWEFLYQGMRWQPVMTPDSPHAATRQRPWGLYEAGGGGFYDASGGRMIQPDMSAYQSGGNAYDPGGLVEGGFGDWFFRNSGAISGAATLGLGVMATVASGGLGALWAMTAGLVTWGYGSSAGGRYVSGQSVGGSLLGGLADITPVGSGYELLTGRDIITGEDLHLSGFDQALNVLDVGLTLLPWARPLRTLAMSHPTAATRLLLGGSAFAGAYLFAGGGIQTAEAGYAKAIGQFAKTARSLPRGAWSLGNGARGFLLEARRIAQMGAQKLPAGFKTFDHIDHATRTAVSIKSMDLLGSSYATAEAILRRGYGVIDDIASFRYAQRRGVELRKGHDFVRTRLEMIIPPGATPAQLQALDQVRAYARSQKVGFKLMVRS